MKNHISVTQIKMFLRCPLQYKFRYIDKMKIPPVGAIILGRSIHEGLEENYKQKKETKVDLSIDKVLEMYGSFFDRAGKKEEVNWKGELPGRIKDSGVGLIKVYQKEISPTIQPISVEEEFNLEFENVSYTLKGYLDLVDHNKVIRETKTSKRSYPQNSASADIQLTAYNLAYKYLKKEDPKALCFDVMVKNKTPKAQSIEAPARTEAELRRFLKLLGAITRAVKAGLFYPCENQQICSWCGFRVICKKWA